MNSEEFINRISANPSKKKDNVLIVWTQG